jgi:hypothetical protein
LAELTGGDSQSWRIEHAPAGTLTIAVASNADLQLSLPASAARGTPAALAAAGATSSRWQLLAVCDLPQEPFKANTIPGVIEAEDYDHGCAGDAYGDRDDINEGGLYRPDGGVDLGECSAGGYTLGWTHKGEWTAYTARVARSGRYRITFHVATAQSGAAFHLESGGTDLTGTIEVPNTKGFQSWTTVERAVDLEAGHHVLRVVIDGDYVNLDKMVFAQAP